MGLPARLPKLAAMKIAIIGRGAIGQYVRSKLAQYDITEVAPDRATGAGICVHSAVHL
jgi:ketopantoate reductase